MEKPKIQSLADSLGLSRVTVWKVLNNRPGVSPKTARRVFAAVKQFRTNEAAPPPLDTSAAGSITLIASRADTSVFWTRIVDQIASELNLHGIGLNYIPIDVMRLSPADLEDMLHPDKTDGLLVINVYNEEILTLLIKSGLPSVYLDTIPGYHARRLYGDLLLLEGERTMAEIAGHLARKGCRRIGFIGDIHYALTNVLRWNGYERGMRENALPIDGNICFTAPIGSDTYPEEIGAFLNGLSTLPDAFICVNDYVAFLVCNLLAGKNVPLPLLTGYDDSREFLLDHLGITTVHVQNGIIGKRMVHQLLFRIQNPSADYEEIMILPQILFRN